MKKDKWYRLPYFSQVALLIDGENGSASAAAAILVRASEWGKVTLRRVYGDWSSSQMHPWRETVTQLGMRAVHQHLPKKNAADIALTVDAMDLFHQGFRRFCLVSSDSDYVPLVLWLMEHGCLVAIIAQNHVPLALQRACSVFVSLEQLGPAGSFSTQEGSGTASAQGSPMPTNRQRRPHRRSRKKRVRSSSSPVLPQTENKV